jgi:hypothetical protein
LRHSDLAEETSGNGGMMEGWNNVKRHKTERVELQLNPPKAVLPPIFHHSIIPFFRILAFKL